jgi:hypothetical protein
VEAGKKSQRRRRLRGGPPSPGRCQEEPTKATKAVAEEVAAVQASRGRGADGRRHPGLGIGSRLSTQVRRRDEPALASAGEVATVEASRGRGADGRRPPRPGTAAGR